MTQRGNQIRSMSVSLGVLVLMMTILGSECRPTTQDMDPIDMCIFSCDFCYKGETLVKCANECIAMEGVVGPAWLRTCKFFGQQQLPNKFRN